MPSVIAIDTGMEVGIVRGYYDAVTPMTRFGYWQFPGGIQGFIKWYWEEDYWGKAKGFEWVVEKFTPRPAQRSFKTAELETIRIEGAIEYALWNEDVHDIHWQRPDKMVLRGGDTPAQRKKNSDQLLKDHGLWLTGKSVQRPDANDVIAATKHLLAYAKSIDHGASLDLYWPESGNG